MKVLFIGHDATRTGAPVMLLTLLRWFKSQGIAIEILLRNGGELEMEYAGVALHRVYDVRTARFSLLRRLWQRKDILEYYRNAGIDLIYSSTITNGSLLEYLSPLKLPVITHVHELENFINSCGAENLAQVKRHTTLFIAPSNAVIENLVSRHGIDQKRIRKVPECISVAEFDSRKLTVSRTQMLEKLQLPSNAFVVGAVGTSDWRKSPDLFVQLAAYTASYYPELPIYFVWVGGELSWELRYDLEKLSLKNIVFMPSTPNLLDYYNCFNVFTLVSRVDPYPLVCLEAALQKRPVICFDKAGGMPEFAEENCGFVVPYLDIAEMAAKVVTLYKDPDLAFRLGEAGMVKVRERHDVTFAGSELKLIFNKCLKID